MGMAEKKRKGRKNLCSLCAAESREKQLNSVSSYVLKQQLVECFLGVSQNPPRTSTVDMNNNTPE